jgi:uncharacterized protein (DUF2336 family)
MTDEHALLKDVENSITSASMARRSEILSKTIDLFCVASEEPQYEDLSIFDDVFTRIAANIEMAARASLAKRLAPIRQAPLRTLRMLAFDDEIEVAGPVLAQSSRLDDGLLLEIAKTKGQSHLLALSYRSTLSDAVTDVMIARGDHDVMLSTADNYGADISDRGFSTLVAKSNGDDLLAEVVGSRPEIPSPLLTQLITQASESVRAKLELSHPRAKAAVRRIVAAAAKNVEAQMRSGLGDYAAALATVEALRQSGRLNEQAIAEFAKAGAYPETIIGLVLMAGLPLQFAEQAMARDRSEPLMIIAKAIGLSWATAQAILALCADKGVISRSQIVERWSSFQQLRSTRAREIVKIFQGQGKAQPAR